MAGDRTYEPLGFLTLGHTCFRSLVALSIRSNTAFMLLSNPARQVRSSKLGGLTIIVGVKEARVLLFSKGISEYPEVDRDLIVAIGRSMRLTQKIT